MNKNIKKIIETLEKALENQLIDTPVLVLMGITKNDPFRILVCGLISTRTKDETTSIVCEKLFNKIKSFEDIRNIDLKALEELLYPAGFYKNKAKFLKEISSKIETVPSSYEELIKLPGIGPKVANLILSEGFKKDAIVVDTHVHRISNRMGLIKTKTALESQKALEKAIPKKYWRKINHLFVALGQKICKPIKPKCDICPVNPYCSKIIKI